MQMRLCSEIFATAHPIYTCKKSRKQANVHEMSFYPERRAEDLDIVEEFIPVVDLRLYMKSSCRPIRVFLAPDVVELLFEYSDGYVNTTVAFQEGHAMLILEYQMHASCEQTPTGEYPGSSALSMSIMEE